MKGRATRRHISRVVLSATSLPRVRTTAKAEPSKSLEFYPGLPFGCQGPKYSGHLLLSPRLGISKTLGQRWTGWDSNQYSNVGYGCSKQWLTHCAIKFTVSTSSLSYSLQDHISVFVAVFNLNRLVYGNMN